MRLYISVLLISLTILQGSQAQFNMFHMGDMGRFFGGFQRGAMNFFKPMQAMFGGFGAARNPNSVANSFGIVGGTDVPQATGRDDLLPADCGRDKKTNKGSLCFPDGLLCEDRVNRVGAVRYGSHNYWLSWLSNDPRLATYKWDWFNARNYCRKRCMDLVSFETRDEYEYFKSIMNTTGVPFVWTSGRLCDFDGCDRPDLFPKNINGWFWSGSQARMAPTDSQFEFHDWSQTGGAGVPQPDNREQLQQGGESESCMAVMNNFYQDGITWHDVACKHDKPIICEDVEGHIQFARQHFPNLRIP